MKLLLITLVLLFSTSVHSNWLQDTEIDSDIHIEMKYFKGVPRDVWWTANVVSQIYKRRCNPWPGVRTKKRIERIIMGWRREADGGRRLPPTKREEDALFQKDAVNRQIRQWCVESFQEGFVHYIKWNGIKLRGPNRVFRKN